MLVCVPRQSFQFVVSLQKMHIRANNLRAIAQLADSENPGRLWRQSQRHLVMVHPEKLLFPELEGDSLSARCEAKRRQLDRAVLGAVLKVEQSDDVPLISLIPAMNSPNRGYRALEQIERLHRWIPRRQAGLHHSNSRRRQTLKFVAERNAAAREGHYRHAQTRFLDVRLHAHAHITHFTMIKPVIQPVSGGERPRAGAQDFEETRLR